jgi:hypothetical protein
MTATGISPREINKLVEDYIGTNAGYLSHFPYAKHEKFYHVYCDLDVDVPSNWKSGSNLNSESVREQSIHAFPTIEIRRPF